jgi:hypothetical protein
LSKFFGLIERSTRGQVVTILGLTVFITDIQLWEGEGRKRVLDGRIWCKYSVYMYVNGKMRPVETIPGMGGGRIKTNGGGEFNYDIFDIL